MSAVCLAAGVLYTLTWTHSVEKTLWEEDWLAEGGKIRIVEARVQGSGAGMEPGEGAVLKDGFWRWQPKSAPMRSLVLTLSPYVRDYRLCRSGQCQSLRDLAPGSDRVELTACPE